MTLIFLLLTIFLPVFAQGDSTIYLESNRAAVLRLAGDGTFATAYYAAAVGDRVSVSAHAPDGLDLVLEILAPDSASVAYVDASAAEGVVQITRVVLTEGVHLVRVGTFNGEGRGEVTLTVSVHETPVLTPESGPLVIPLGRSEIAHIALSGFDSGQTYAITVRDPRGVLDPYLVLLDGDEVRAVNDDHGLPDPSLNRFDSHLRIPLVDGMRIQVTEFLGRAGFLEVRVTPADD